MRAIVACGEDEQNGGGSAGGHETSDQGPVHVHGLGIDPNDGALCIAHHTGLFRADSGESKARRVGDSTPDTMRFAIIRPDRFLGSGHAGASESGPNPLRVIRSCDAGRTWPPVSLDGEADFHVLRCARGTVLGSDSTSVRPLASGHGGESWDERSPPARLLDLAPDPRDPHAVPASGGGALYPRSDGGRRWRPLGGKIDLLAWPKRGRLFHVNGAETVSLSEAQRESWRPPGQIGGQPAAFAAQTERDRYAALPDAPTKQSTDGARSWTVRSAP